MSLDLLRTEWVYGALVVDVGQLGSCDKGTLAQRVQQVIRFGQAACVAHWGGRLIGRLSQTPKLTNCRAASHHLRVVIRQVKHRFRQPALKPRIVHEQLE